MSQWVEVLSVGALRPDSKSQSQIPQPGIAACNPSTRGVETGKSRACWLDVQPC